MLKQLALAVVLSLTTATTSLAGSVESLCLFFGAGYENVFDCNVTDTFNPIEGVNQTVVVTDDQGNQSIFIWYRHDGWYVTWSGTNLEVPASLTNDVWIPQLNHRGTCFEFKYENAVVSTCYQTN